MGAARARRWPDALRAVPTCVSGAYALPGSCTLCAFAWSAARLSRATGPSPCTRTAAGLSAAAPSTATPCQTRAWTCRRYCPSHGVAAGDAVSVGVAKAVARIACRLGLFAAMLASSAALADGTLVIASPMVAGADRPRGFGAPVAPRESPPEAAILAYRWLNDLSSPVRRCRLQPTCSRFALQALARISPALAILMTLGRVQMEHDHQGGLLAATVAEDGGLLFHDPVGLWLLPDPSIDGAGGTSR